MDFPHGFLLIWTAIIFYNLGTIWFCQLVIYPLFTQVGAAEYTSYHRFYSGHIPLPVIIPGFSSFLLPILLVFLRPPSIPLWLILANVICGLVGLMVTVALAIPRHHQLEKVGKLDQVIHELILYNWPRTASISLSACCTLLMLTYAFSSR